MYATRRQCTTKAGVVEGERTTQPSRWRRGAVEANPLREYQRLTRQLQLAIRPPASVRPATVYAMTPSFRKAAIVILKFRMVA